MLQTKSQGHLPLGSREYFKCLNIYGRGGRCKVGTGQPRIIISENLVEPTLIMLHTLSRTHWPFGFRDDFKGILFVWEWWPSWSCNHKQIETWIQFGPGHISS